jgi:hypothetical protein
MNIQELTSRIKSAIIILSTGNPYNIGDINFNYSEGFFSVTGWSLSGDLKYISHNSACKELCEIKILFKKMTGASKELSDFIANKNIAFILKFDYGMGAIEICSECNGVIKWNI